MEALITDPDLAAEFIAQRQAAGVDKYDEVWDGVYIMSPLADNEHQRIVSRLTAALIQAIEDSSLGHVYAGANVSNRRDDWKSNYRCPDVLVFIAGSTAEDLETHWFGGPEFAVEVVSRGDRTYEKLPFYASVGTRELLVIDRSVSSLMLFRNIQGELVEVAASTAESPVEIQSEVLPLTFNVSAALQAFAIVISSNVDKRSWLIRSAR